MEQQEKTKWRNKQNRCLLVILLGILISIPVYSQNKAISGTVKDDMSGEALIGVSVMVKETSNCKSAHDNGLTPFYWDDSGTGIGLGQSGIFNRATGEFVQRNEQAVEVMLRAVSDNAPKYTLQSIYDRAPEKED